MPIPRCNWHYWVQFSLFATFHGGGCAPAYRSSSGSRCDGITEKAAAAGQCCVEAECTLEAGCPVSSAIMASWRAASASQQRRSTWRSTLLGWLARGASSSPVAADGTVAMRVLAPIAVEYTRGHCSKIQQHHLESCRVVQLIAR